MTGLDGQKRKKRKKKKKELDRSPAGCNLLNVVLGYWVGRVSQLSVGYISTLWSVKM